MPHYFACRLTLCRVILRQIFPSNFNERQRASAAPRNILSTWLASFVGGAIRRWRHSSVVFELAAVSFPDRPQLRRPHATFALLAWLAYVVPPGHSSPCPSWESWEKDLEFSTQEQVA